MTNSSPDISGLRYQSDYISEEQQAQLLADIEHQSWLTGLKRRVQHYGYRYDYTRRSVDRSLYLGPLPEWLMPLVLQLRDDSFFVVLPDQVIVNEYEPGQGISAHIDCIPCFGDTIASISLLAPTTMIFSHPDRQESVPILIQPRSLLVMQQDARYIWKHAIPPRKADQVDGQIVERGRRISLTFRSVSSANTPSA